MWSFQTLGPSKDGWAPIGGWGVAHLGCCERVCLCVCVQMLSISRLSKQNNNKTRKVSCQKVA